MFEKASRLKLRFKAPQGNLLVEDLWDLDLQGLNSLAKKYNKELKVQEEEDFLAGPKKENEELRLKFNLTLHILKTKQEEIELAKNAKAAKAKKEKILSILEKKKDAALENMSEEELMKQLEEG